MSATSRESVDGEGIPAYREAIENSIRKFRALRRGARCFVSAEWRIAVKLWALIAGLALCAGCQAPGEATKIAVAQVWMRSGDLIRISSIRGDRVRLEAGGNYIVEGKYRLGSHDAAILVLGSMDGTLSGETRERVTRGEGEFRFTFVVVNAGFPHVSFYPEDGGESFGGAFFSEGELIELKTP